MISTPPDLLLSEYMYQWASTGEVYDPRVFHMFEEENGVIKPDITMGRCVDVEHDTDNDVDVWITGPCEVAAAYVCEKPLSRYPESKVHGANMGPTWGRQDPGWPHEPCYLGIVILNIHYDGLKMTSWLRCVLDFQHCVFVWSPLKARYKASFVGARGDYSFR